MAVRSSLEDVTSIKQTEGEIRLMLQSPRLAIPIVLVEGIEDSEFYRKHLCANTIVLVPVNEYGKGNWRMVTQVTENLHHEFSRCNVIGIRDKDYSEYEQPPCPSSEWVLFSEGHSLECMLLMSENVRNEFNACLPLLQDHFQNVLSDCRHIAGYYIYNAIKGLHVRFHAKKMHLINYYDACTRSMKDSWKELLQSDFSNLCVNIPIEDIWQMLTDLGVDERTDWDICRGHDIVDVCYDMGKAHGIEKKELMNRMISAYTFNDFLSTSVYARLRGLEESRSIEIIKS